MPTLFWKESVQEQITLLHRHIAALDGLGAAPDATAPYYRLLDQLYEKEMPLARAMDQSDLLLHLDGRELLDARPRLGLVASILTDVRKQVSGVMQILLGVLNDPLVPAGGIDLQLTSFAPGSLYLGFNLPESDAQKQFLSDDPFRRACRDALTLVGQFASQLQTEEQARAIERLFPDPHIRDAGLSAIFHLSPTGRRGFDSMDVLVNAMPEKNWSKLSPFTRQRAAALLKRHERPPAHTRQEIIRGSVRQLDLDARRLQLRLDEPGAVRALRCVYPPRFDREAKTWLNTRVEIVASVEEREDGRGLLHIEKIRVIPR